MATSKPRAKTQPNNFLEALRELGNDFKSEAKVQVTKMVSQDVPQSLGLSGTLKQNESVSVDEIAAAEAKGEQKAEGKFASRLSQIREEERAYYLRLESQTKQQIIAIQNEIQLLAKSAGSLAREVEVAATQAPANPGVYHRNFFIQLKELIVNLRRKVQDSQQWLSVTNSRARRKGFFWGQVQSSGTKYMLSSERYMVMSTG